jgi:hypothetical protein
MGPRVDLDAMADTTIAAPVGNRTPVVQSVAIHLLIDPSGLRTGHFLDIIQTRYRCGSLFRFIT